MLVCPSILEYKPEDYIYTINKLSLYYKYFQIDFADGIYVDNKTASLDEFIKLLKGSDQSDPYKNITFDFHFMVKDYKEHIKKIESIKNLINIKYVFVHYNLYPNLKEMKEEYSFPIGLVFNPGDKIGDIANHYILKEIPFIQIMSIIPGAQGKPFMPETLKKIEQLRLLGYRNKIYLDGAVNDKTIPQIYSLKYKPDYICPGSYLTRTDNLEGHVKFLISNS